MKRLAILICTIDTRQHFLKRLLDILKPQLTTEVQLFIDADRGEVSIGEKRQRMLDQLDPDEHAYCCFIDDDDVVADDYVAALLAALDTQPDVVGFGMARYRDGRWLGRGIHSIRYDAYRNRWHADGTRTFERTPSHLNPVRTELAKAVGFKPLNSEEDVDYSTRLRPLLKTEVFIDRDIYIYELRSIRPGEVTNAHTPQVS